MGEGKGWLPSPILCVERLAQRLAMQVKGIDFGALIWYNSLAIAGKSFFYA